MRKTVAAAAMAASLTVGGAAGVALFQPALSGAQTDSTAETAPDPGTDLSGLRARAAERIQDKLQPLVDDETITDEQATAVAELLASDAPFRHGPGRGFGMREGFGDEVAGVLGLSAEELRTELAAGKSLADVAEEQGVDVQEVIDAMVAAHRARLDQAVADGHLTQEQADERASEFEDHVQDMVEHTFDGRFGRHHDGPGDLDDAETGTTDS